MGKQRDDSIGKNGLTICYLDTYDANESFHFRLNRSSDSVYIARPSLFYRLSRYEIPSSLLLALALTPLATVRGADAKTYQVTGPVIEFNDTAITVMKGEEKWQIARDMDTKVNGDLKVGSKVTVEYRMVATTVEIKAAKASEKADKVEKAGEKAEKKNK